MKLKKAMITGSIAAVVVLTGSTLFSLISDHLKANSLFSCTSPEATEMARGFNMKYLDQVAFIAAVSQSGMVDQDPAGVMAFTLSSPGSDRFNEAYTALTAPTAPHAEQYKKLMANASSQVESLVEFTGYGEIEGQAHNENIKPCSAVVSNVKTKQAITVRYSVIRNKDGSIGVRTNPAKNFR